jgi:hypothetical protein
MNRAPAIAASWESATTARGWRTPPDRARLGCRILSVRGKGASFDSHLRCIGTAIGTGEYIPLISVFYLFYFFFSVSSVLNPFHRSPPVTEPRPPAIDH